ncbi:periplasmic chaperone for outer membrane proteins Skp [Anseongella ginsenosidimutans]|uniref:Periplasmic chaperone for outer membrane proteins Skp n=1 Tax=Anseongella ginsenosidimutans TaxID=496056 RepID=A0A4R3KY01_9SPHI|nr:OmpH family outer membrane protein [Anseongella ginsenosidimutans]QEC50982.1 OmpH family outer membrane protein [Anseongella ginsenosidimutans]TCS90368.1 periplasmic chaperone for outer membrane proteins Skp [Anseongella ginsenosidimutans]
MKYLIKCLGVAACCLLIGNVAQAQIKIGYLNTSELIALMPETKAADSQFNAFAQKLQQTLQPMQQDLQTKFAEYQEQQATMADAVKESKEKELQDLNERIDQFQLKSQQDMQKKREELMGPILEKVQTAIKAVAASSKFTYILDSNAILHGPEGDNVLPLVKKELGIN